MTYTYISVHLRRILGRGARDAAACAAIEALEADEDSLFAKAAASEEPLSA